MYVCCTVWTKVGSAAGPIGGGGGGVGQARRANHNPNNLPREEKGGGVQPADQKIELYYNVMSYRTVSGGRGGGSGPKGCWLDKPGRGPTESDGGRRGAVGLHPASQTKGRQLSSRPLENLGFGNWEGGVTGEGDGMTSCHWDGAGAQPLGSKWGYWARKRAVVEAQAAVRRMGSGEARGGPWGLVAPYPRGGIFLK